jgi:MFS family permease
MTDSIASARASAPVTPVMEQWILIAGLGLLAAVGIGATINVLPLFLAPIAQETGWATSRTAMLGSVFLLGWTVTAPAAGYFMDRFGPRRIILIGGVLAAAGYVMAAKSIAYPQAVAAIALAGTGAGASTVLPAMALIGRRVSVGRNLATGIVIGASSIGSVIFAPLLSTCVQSFGWRPVFIAIAAAIAFVTLLVGLVAVRGPDGNLPLPTASAASSRDHAGKALRAKWFWLVLPISMLGNYAAVALLFAAASQYAHAGYSPAEVAWLYALHSGASFFGYLCIGFLADRFGPRVVLPFAFAALAAACVLPVFATTTTVGKLVTLCFALTWGATNGCATQLVPIILLEGVGLRRYGTLYGTISFASGLAAASAPAATGAIQLLGGVDAGFLATAAISFIALLLAVYMARQMTPIASDDGPGFNPP